MIHIKRINESKGQDISVLDIEDDLQEVWDKYRVKIDNYVIKREFIDNQFVLSFGDQSVVMGNDMEVKDVEIDENQSHIFMILIDISTGFHIDWPDWGECGVFDMGQMVDFITLIKKCLSYRTKQKIGIGIDSPSSQNPNLKIEISLRIN